MDYYSQETERIILRKLTEKDIDTWAEFFVDNPNAHFIGLDLSLPKHELAKIWIDKQLKRKTLPGFTRNNVSLQASPVLSSEHPISPVIYPS